MRRHTKVIEKFIQQSSLEEDISFSPEESNYLKMIKTAS